MRIFCSVTEALNLVLEINVKCKLVADEPHSHEAGF